MSKSHGNSSRWNEQFSIWSNPAHLSANAAARLAGLHRAQRQQWLVAATGAILSILSTIAVSLILK